VTFVDRVLLAAVYRLEERDWGLRLLAAANGLLSRCFPYVPPRTELSSERTDSLVPTEVRPSTVPGAGMGLFLCVPVEAGEVIVEYSGDIVSTVLQRYRLRDWSYLALTADPAVAIDALKRPEAKARYINHHFDPGLRNTDTLMRDGRRFVVAKRRIEAGEELFYSYGDRYWKFRAFRHGN
jgi:hypothetical protein